MNAPINAAASADIDGRYAWLRLVVSVVLSAVGGVGTWAVIVVLPAVQAEFGTDRGQASLAYTATMLGFAAGKCARRPGHRPLRLRAAGAGRRADARRTVSCSPPMPVPSSNSPLSRAC